MIANYFQIPVPRFLSELLCSLHIDTNLQLQKIAELYVEDLGCTSSTLIHRRFCTALNEWIATSQLDYVVKTTAGGNMPSLCVYERNKMATQASTSSLRLPHQDCPNVISIAAVAWAWVATIIDIVSDEHDLAKGYLSALLDRQEASVRKIMQYQHRRHVFTLLAYGREMHLVLWDRAGTVVSEAFPYLEDSDVLRRFLFALFTSTRASQGYDESITLATPEQIRALECYQPDSSYSDSVKAELQQAKESILGESEASRIILPIGCVKCPDVAHRMSRIPQERRTFTYLIRRAHPAPPFLDGHGTKRFVAFDVDHNQLVTITDQWTLDNSVRGNKPVLDIHEDFSRIGVRWVPTVIAGGPVGTQVTTTQTFYPETENNPSGRRKRYHHRLIVSQIWRPLWAFKDSLELVSSVNDALTAHQDAHELAGLLHRDVTADSILIDMITRRGFLDDWHMSISRDDVAGSARMGTWTYMSGLLQTYPRKPNTLSDDLESFVWSLVLPVLRFIVNDQSMILRCKDGTIDIDLEQYNDMLNNFVERTFHFKFRNGDHICGGRWKIEQIILYEDFAVKAFDQSGPLARLLDDLFALLHEFYVSLDEAALKAQFGALGARPSARPRKSWKMGYEGPRTRSNCLDSHERMRAIFSTVLNNPPSAWMERRTVDQFLGISSYNSSSTESPLQHSEAFSALGEQQ